MSLAEARPEIEGDSCQLPRKKSECLPQPPKTPEIPLVVIERRHGRIDVGTVVGINKRRFRKDLLQIEVIAGERAGKVVEEKKESARLQFIGHQDPPKPEPHPENRKKVSIDY